MLKLIASTWFSTFLLISGLLSSHAYAYSSTISKAFNYNGNPVNGSIVALNSVSSNTVSAASEQNQKNLVGVVVNGNQSLLAVNPANDTTQVATEGTVYCLVSTVNGNISTGDQISVSPFSGVGMKAVSGDKTIGIAESSFSRSSKGQNFPEKTVSGQTVNVFIGYIKLLILIGPSNNSSSVVNGIQNFTEALVGKQISLDRIIISLVIASLAIISIITIAYSSIDGAIISLGRNPLAKKNIFHVLRNISGFSILILIFAAGVVYLLLY